MVPPELHLINPVRLAERQEGVTGTVPLCALQRIREVVRDDKGNINFELHFGKDEQGVVFILGEYRANLKVACQRCMQPMDLPLQGTISLGIINQNDAQNFSDRYEPLTLNDNEISLETLLEEEILLALPIAPVHEREHCEGSRIVEKYRPERESPFAVLKNFNRNK